MNTHTQAHELHPPRLSLGFGSQFSIVECVLSAITDEFHSVLKNRWPSIIFRTSVIMFTYFMGLPMVTRVSVRTKKTDVIIFLLQKLVCYPLQIIAAGVAGVKDYTYEGCFSENDV